jgi:probable HAF family extracellular repeat protein
MADSRGGSFFRVAAVIPIFAAMAASAAPSYRAVDLTAVVGASMTPVAVNNEGIVAVSGFANGQRSSLLYDVATGQVVYRFPAGDGVEALSDSGNAAGTAWEGWLLSRGVRTSVPLGHPLGVNDAGQVVGFGGGFYARAALFNSVDGTFTDLGTFGGKQGVARAINQDGQIAGHASFAGEQTAHAFRWFRGVMTDLGTLGGVGSSYSYAIDGEGRVAGTAVTASGEAHAFVFDDSGMHDLGTRPGCTRSAATAMNGEQDVVGYSDLCSTSASWGFVVTRGTRHELTDLVAPAADGFIYARPTGINDDGVIVGIATSRDGFYYRPFLLVPESGR